MVYHYKTLNSLPKKFIDARLIGARQDDGICSDHDEDCYTPYADGTPHNALKCWMESPECGTCPLLSQGKEKYD